MAKNGLVEPFVGVGFWDFFDWVEGNFDWVELGGIGIARAHSRSHARFYCETTPPINPILLDNNNWLGHDPHCVNSINVL